MSVNTSVDVINDGGILSEDDPQDEETPGRNQPAPSTSQDIRESKEKLPRHRKMTVKGQNYAVKLKEREFTSAVTAWKKIADGEEIQVEHIDEAAKRVEKGYNELIPLLGEAAAQKSTRILERVQLKTQQLLELAEDESDVETVLDSLLSDLDDDGSKSSSNSKSSLYHDLEDAETERNKHPETTQDTQNTQEKQKAKVIGETLTAANHITASGHPLPRLETDLADVMDRLELPRQEIPTFDGNPLKYSEFMMIFEDVVGSKRLTADSKLRYLLKSVKGSAHEAIKPCLLMSGLEGYSTALKTLKRRFGDSFLIARAHVRELTDGPPLKPESNAELLAFSDQVQACKLTLRSLGRTWEIDSQEAMAKLVKRLPKYVQTRWRKLAVSHKKQSGDYPPFFDFADFIESVAEEANDALFGSIEKTRPEKRVEKKARAQGSVFSGSTEGRCQRNSKWKKPAPVQAKQPQFKPTCPQCNQEHYLNQCPEFRAFSVKQRVEFVQRNNLCYNCFGRNHVAENCVKTWRCNIDGCGAKHNRWLHMAEDSGQPERDASDFSTNVDVDLKKVVLPIKRVHVRSANGSYVEALALHDSGSDTSLCNEALLKKLKLPSDEVEVTFNTASGKEKGKFRMTTLSVKGVDCESEFQMRDVIVRTSINIGGRCMVSRGELKPHPHLRDLDVPDAGIQDVELLIGQDNPELLIPLEVRRGEAGAPFAVRTELGWGISGPVTEARHVRSSSTFFLDRHWDGTWNDHTPAAEEVAMSRIDKEVLDHWNKNVKIEEDHYVLPIPFKEKPPALEDNYEQAERRLRSLGKRLQANEELREQYTTSIMTYVTSGHAEPVGLKCKLQDQTVWYLPHHPVSHPKKPGRVRVVFDCASEYRGSSLNKTVHQGPCLTNNLVSVLTRFRTGKIAISADIEAMFCQVRVPEEDRDVLRFLWWKDNDMEKSIICYRMCTHLFGGNWSPSAACFALRKLTEDFGCSKGVQETVLRNFYVDDCLRAVDSEEEAIDLVQGLSELLSKAGFKLKKWISNSKEVMKAIPPEERAATVVTVDLDTGDLPADRMLGVLWDVEEDCFRFEIRLKDRGLTKREVLSATCSVYDPLGFISPFVLKARAIFQEACRAQVGWDERLPDKLLDQWQHWLSDTALLSQLRIPRCLGMRGNTCYLHVFCDASELGYGAVAYLKSAESCTLVMAKTRLAPLKSTSIPRLELTAAVLGAEMGTLLQQSLEATRVYLWTDSTTVLRYLANREQRFKTFVANRVEKILCHSEIDQWGYVPSADNPADDASRGLTAEEMVCNARWVSGPRFLSESEENWPEKRPEDQLTLKDEDRKELKKETQIYYVGSSSSTVERLTQYYSSWNALKKGVAWLLRLKAILCKKKICKGRLSVEELEEAEKTIILHVQASLPNQESLRALDVFECGSILKVGGRLKNSPIPDAAKHPIALPKDHYVSKLIARHYHILNGHSGSQRTLADMREKFWPISGHSLVKEVVGKCVKCRKIRASCQVQKMADLPKDRVSPAGAPFENTGVDYFGPILVKKGRTEHKRYGCVFTCLSTRAVHIELATSLDTDSFLMALQRFMARRGQPSHIRCDNGTNFVGARNEMMKSIKEWNLDQIHERLLQKNISWTFNPPAASHMGGVWERQIRTVRAVMMGVCDTQRMTDESLATLFCKVESIVNGRPITKLSNDPNDLRPLTPNHLLLFKANPSTKPPGKFVLQDLYRKRWRQVEYLTNLFWTRWTKEYLPLLQMRPKWSEVKRNMHKGDLVLLCGKAGQRNEWPLGLIIETYPGPDGLVRSVKLRTKDGELTRPITKLCLLEAHV